MRQYGYRGLRGLSPLGQAIAKAEGYGPAGNVPTIANNPGDLELGNIGFGVTKASGGQIITNFPTPEAGQAALENQINLIASGKSKAGYTPDMTISQVGQLYSGSQSSTWATSVASALGVSPDTNFSSLAGGAAAGDSTAAAAGTTLDSGLDITDLLSGISPYLIAGVAALGVLILTLDLSD